MTTKLYEWLRSEFYKSNHAKYKHLFEIWVSNITQAQIDGFSKQMYNKENKILWNRQMSPKWEDSPVEIELSNVKIHYY